MPEPLPRRVPGAAYPDGLPVPARVGPDEYANLPVFNPDDLIVLDPDARCPAATGIPGDLGIRCRVHSDGAHRCYRGPRHMLDDRIAVAAGTELPDGLTFADHVCDCNFAWSSGPTVQQQAEQLNHARRGY